MFEDKDDGFVKPVKKAESPQLPKKTTAPLAVPSKKKGLFDDDEEPVSQPPIKKSTPVKEEVAPSKKVAKKGGLFDDDETDDFPVAKKPIKRGVAKPTNLFGDESDDLMPAPSKASKPAVKNKKKLFDDSD